MKIRAFTGLLSLGLAFGLSGTLKSADIQCEYQIAKYGEHDDFRTFNATKSTLSVTLERIASARWEMGYIQPLRHSSSFIYSKECMKLTWLGTLLGALGLYLSLGDVSKGIAGGACLGANLLNCYYTGKAYVELCQCREKYEQWIERSEVHDYSGTGVSQHTKNASATQTFKRSSQRSLWQWIKQSF